MVEAVNLKTGYTTGTCAAAAAKGAAFALFGDKIKDAVEITLPGGEDVSIPIHQIKRSKGKAFCSVIKDAGDDPDITDGLRICAELRMTKGHDIEIFGGEGVGLITKPGLQVKAGEPAINPVPKKMIRDAVREVIGERGAQVTISVPGGKEIAAKTFNPKLGIIGGISIIGTTGIVRPMSVESLKSSLVCGLDVAKAEGFDTVFLVPGMIGERSVLKHFSVHNDQVIQMSNFVGFMLKETVRRKFKNVILAGHPGKLAKLISGDFDTHSSKSISATNVISDILTQTGCDKETLDKCRDANTVEAQIQELADKGKLDVFNEVAREIEKAVSRFMAADINTGVVLFSMAGDVIGVSKGAKKWLLHAN